MQTFDWDALDGQESELQAGPIPQELDKWSSRILDWTSLACRLVSHTCQQEILPWSSRWARAWSTMEQCEIDPFDGAFHWQSTHQVPVNPPPMENSKKSPSYSAICSTFAIYGSIWYVVQMYW